MLVDQFDYFLPPELIAQHPPERRDGGRLLLLDKETGVVSHHRILDLPRLLPGASLLVFNDSRVIPARLWARRATGGRVEILLLEKLESNPGDQEVWSCMLRSSKAPKEGERLAVEPNPEVVSSPPEVTVLTRPEGGRGQVKLKGASRVADHGSMPLPPYIQRADIASDRERYQTVYSREEGSVAAPTAGLHFTEELLRRIEDAGVERTTVTLHVGPGTFTPVRAERVEDHQMESERCWVPEETAVALSRASVEKRKVIAIGTTAVRTLESSRGQPGQYRTDLFITPGFEFSVVEGMLTNFHLPRSTLLMLVSALAGREQIKNAYRVAVEEKYRFYSYGDAMLIL